MKSNENIHYIVSATGLIGLFLMVTSVIMSVIKKIIFPNASKVYTDLYWTCVALVFVLGMLYFSAFLLLTRQLKMQSNIEKLEDKIRRLEEANDNLEWSNKQLKDDLGNCEDQLKWIFNIAPDKELDDEYKKYLFRQIFLEEIPVYWDREGRHKEI